MAKVPGPKPRRFGHFILRCRFDNEIYRRISRCNLAGDGATLFLDLKEAVTPFDNFVGDVHLVVSLVGAGAEAPAGD